MKAFPTPLMSRAAPLIIDNIDTDTIIPSREMRSTGRTGLADGLFAPLRYSNSALRTEDPEFILNQAPFRESAILLGGANFGCGSSREHAVWALAEWGILCIIAESFAPIFHGNCIRNGILPITIERAKLAEFAGEILSVDLAAQEVLISGRAFAFSVDPEAKQMIAKGLDPIDLTLTQRPAMEDWVLADRIARPWVYLKTTQSREERGQ